MKRFSFYANFLLPFAWCLLSSKESSQTVLVMVDMNTVAFQIYGATYNFGVEAHETWVFITRFVILSISCVIISIFCSCVGKAVTLLKLNFWYDRTTNCICYKCNKIFFLFERPSKTQLIFFLKWYLNIISNPG